MISKIRVIILLSTIVLTGCASENESQALEDIGNYYGCQASFKKGVSTSTEEGSRKTFTIELSGGKILSELEPEKVASHAAYMLYRRLSKEERINYTHVVCIIDQKRTNGSRSSEIEFSMNDLELVTMKSGIIGEISDLIAVYDLDGLFSKMPAELQEDIDREAFETGLRSSEEDYGIILDQLITGFVFFETELEGKNYALIQIYTTFIREKENVRGHLVVSTDPEDDRIFGFNF